MNKPMKAEGVRYIVIHCSDSPDNMEVTAEDIHRWHCERGWDGIGYHKVIQRDGSIENGRPLFWQGSHVKGHNHESIGICLIGDSEPSWPQSYSLKCMIDDLTKQFPNAKVVGHRDLDDRKTCPNMDVSDFMGRWRLV